MDHRNGRAPVALAGDAPIAEPVSDGRLADALAFGPTGHFFCRLVRSQSVVGAALNKDAPVLEQPGRRIPRGAGRDDDLADRQAVFPGEIEIAAVMGRNGHDRSRPVLHQDVIGQPNRDGFARERIDGGDAGVHAFLLGLADLPLGPGGGDRLGKPGAKLGLPGPPDQIADQGMLGRKNEERRPKDRVQAGGENPDRFPKRRHVEIQIGALASADPIFLHGQDVFGPLAQLGVTGEELVGVGGDFEEPLFHLFLLDGRGAAPANTAGRLLVGQDGPAGRAPIDPAFPAIGQAALNHLEEDPLVPGVVFGQTRVDFPRPVVGEPHPLELGLHVGDIIQRPLLGMDAGLNGGVLGRHAQGVPADGMENIIPPHHLKPGDHVADGIVADVAHVDPARRIGIHLEGVKLRAAGIGGRGESAGGVPLHLPAGLDGLEIVISGGVILAHDRCVLLAFVGRRNGRAGMEFRVQCRGAGGKCQRSYGRQPLRRLPPTEDVLSAILGFGRIFQRRDDPLLGKVSKA
ncbi:MAG: hypothetical protein BWX98_01829 [Candidatus Aminicenantes bacterium ADurb.Bin147]|nr:MAG: hypothetical protein BWX98_01829 [Candidatus Aminicenantes bacterium ADurb.Bin147]